MKRHPLIAFFVLTFTITWGMAAVLFAFMEPLTARFGDLDLSAPFWKGYWHVATYAPAIAAFGVLGAVHGGAGIRAYARRLLHWRVGWRWYAVVFLGFPALMTAGHYLSALFGPPPGPAFTYVPWYSVFPALLFALVNDPGPVEELGWRGFALPLLQQRYSALGATLILGSLWATWHLPAFYISTLSQSALSFPVFFLSGVLLSVLMTAVYNGTGGSIPIAFLIHAVTNFNLADHPNLAAERQASAVVLLVASVIVVARLGAGTLGATKFTDVIPAVDARTPEPAAS